MNTDFLDELGELALGSRLKRLSERMMADAGEVYQYFDLDVLPKWFTLLALLEQKGPIGVVDAASYLGLTQPAISQFSRQLEKKGLLSMTVSAKDQRRKLMQLTAQGLEQVSIMQSMWQAVDAAAKELCVEQDNDFYQALITFEKALERRSLKARTLENLNEPATS